MLRTKAIRKIFLTTLTVFILLTVFTITKYNNDNDNVLRTNLEIEDIAGLKTNVIYLLNDEGLLVQDRVLLDGSSVEENLRVLLLIM